MEETNKAKLGVVLTDFIMEKKLSLMYLLVYEQDDLNISDVYNIMRQPFKRFRKGFEKVRCNVNYNNDILPTHIYPK